MVFFEKGLKMAKNVTIYGKNIYCDSRNIPILTHEEERDLFIKFHDGDIDAAYTLVISYMRWVNSIVAKYVEKNPLICDDLFQEGMIKVMHCMKNFDVNYGARFITYAHHHVERALLEYTLKNSSAFTIGTGETNLKLAKKSAKLLSHIKSREGRDSIYHRDITEISDALDVDESTVISFVNRNNVVSIVKSNEDGDEIDVFETLPTDFDMLEQIDNESRARFDVSELISVLDDRERDILLNRYVNEQKLTLKELSLMYGVSIERVRQIESKAISKLKTAYNTGVEV